MNKKSIGPTIIFILLLLGMTTFVYIPINLFHINYDNFSEKMKILYMFSCDLGFMIIVFILYYKEVINDFKNYFKNFKKNFTKSFKYYLIGFIIMVVSNNLISIFFSDASANNEEAIRSLIQLYPIYMFFSVAIYAPFVEELIFRKSIRDSVLAFGNNKITKYVYIIISGLIFSSLHVVGMEKNILDYLYIIPYLGLGIAFAKLYYDSDNIFSSIFMHSLHNTWAIVFYLLVGVI